ncbi:MAG: ribosome assembly cofactor RimP [Bacteroidia bacterium]|nr:ribosome assembly cofactor RimP [Bacteroidia bacterium]
MIDSDLIRKIVVDGIAGTGIFLVDISVKQGDRIYIYIDRLEGVTIDDCKMISRLVESKLDRNEYDYALEVSSPGLTGSFKVPEQYLKHVGKEIEVTLNSGIKIKGILSKAEESEIEIEYKKQEKGIKIKGIKNDEILVKERIGFSDIKSAKAVITFN